MEPKFVKTRRGKDILVKGINFKISRSYESAAKTIFTCVLYVLTNLLYVLSLNYMFKHYFKLVISVIETETL